MNIEQQALENHQVKLTVQVESSQLEEAKHKAARHISQHKKIPGFRPGKAPYPIILRNFGEEAILEEALDILVKDIYPKVIEESKIKPYGPGSLENLPKLDPVTFEFIVPLEPEVTLGDYKQIRIPYKLKAVSNKDINKVLDDLRERQVVLEPSNNPAMAGDQVFIILSINRAQPAEGEIPALVNDRKMPVVISSDKVNKSEWPFPGFSQYLVGMTSGEEKSFLYTYPEDSDFKDLRGKETEVKIKVEEVKKRILPALNDEFAQAVGEQYNDFATLNEEIRKSLESQAKQEYDEDYHDKIMKFLLKESVVKFPPQMLERETDMLIDQLSDRLAQQKMDMETYLKMRKIDAQALREEIKPQAEERLQRTLILLEISKAENIHVENAELESETKHTLDEVGRMITPDQARKTLTNDFIRRMIGNIGADLLVKHTWEYLDSVARGEKEEKVAESIPAAAGEETSLAEVIEKPKRKIITKKVEKE